MQTFELKFNPQLDLSNLEPRQYLNAGLSDSSIHGADVFVLFSQRTISKWNMSMDQVNRSGVNTFIKQN